MVKFTATKEPTSIHQIEEVERLTGLSFPSQYKTHLLKFNRGKCHPNIFSFIENGRITHSRVHWFLAIHDDEYDNLKDYIETYKIEEKRLPHHILPIADDPFGNLICISCGSSDYGVIYFWDHENEVDYEIADDNDYSNLYRIADNFDVFLENLKEDE